MTKHHLRKPCILLLILLFALACTAMALASDAELPERIPGTWIYTVDEDPAALTLNPDGTMTLHSYTEDLTYEGTWELEILTEPSDAFGGYDKLTLRFTATDNPKYDGDAYSVTCVYAVFAEIWFEDSGRYTILNRIKVSSDGTTPFADLCEQEDYPYLMRTEGPNMRVVNCKSFVSLREERSAKSARLAKVPLGAEVFAFPEESEMDGFIHCVYGDKDGYILAEYLVYDN